MSHAFFRKEKKCGLSITLCSFLFSHYFYTFSWGVTALSPCPPAFIQRMTSRVHRCCRGCCCWQSRFPWTALSWCPGKRLDQCSLKARTVSTCWDREEHKNTKQISCTVIIIVSSSSSCTDSSINIIIIICFRQPDNLMSYFTVHPPSQLFLHAISHLLIKVSVNKIWRIRPLVNMNTAHPCECCLDSVVLDINKTGDYICTTT